MSYQSFNDWVAAFKEVPPHPPGLSPLEKLPNEILNHILQYATIANTGELSPFMKDNLPGNPNTPVKKPSLLNCLLVSRTMRDVGLPVLYRSPLIGPRSLKSFMHTLTVKTHYSKFVRSLGFVRIRSPSDLQDLPACIELCPLLRKLSVPGELFDVPELVTRILFEFPRLDCLHVSDRAVGWQDPLPSDHLNDVAPDITCSITSLSFDFLTCGKFLEALLPRCPHLTSLDLTGCHLSRGMLSSVNKKAQLKTLVLDNSNLETEDIVDFLAEHGASLDVLNLGELSLYNEDLADVILDNLPATLHSLNIGRFCVLPSHFPIIQGLTTHLEELAIGTGISIQQLEEILLGSQYDLQKSPVVAPYRKERDLITNRWIPRDPVVKARLQLRLNSLVAKADGSLMGAGSRIKHLDLRTMDISRNGLENSILLGPQSLPLDTIEFRGNLGPDLQDMESFLASLGWKFKSGCGRYWIERRK